MTVRPEPTLFDVRGPVDGSAVAGNWGDEDIPLEVRRELLKVAAHKSISYYYLCAIYRKGFEDRGLQQFISRTGGEG